MWACRVNCVMHSSSIGRQPVSCFLESRNQYPPSLATMLTWFLLECGTKNRSRNFCFVELRSKICLITRVIVSKELSNISVTAYTDSTMSPSTRDLGVFSHRAISHHKENDVISLHNTKSNT